MPTKGLRYCEIDSVILRSTNMLKCMSLEDIDSFKKGKEQGRIYTVAMMKHRVTSTCDAKGGQK